MWHKWNYTYAIVFDFFCKIWYLWDPSVTSLVTIAYCFHSSTVHNLWTYQNLYFYSIFKVNLEFFQFLGIMNIVSACIFVHMYSHIRSMSLFLCTWFHMSLEEIQDHKMACLALTCNINNAHQKADLYSPWKSTALIVRDHNLICIFVIWYISVFTYIIQNIYIEIIEVFNMFLLLQLLRGRGFS
jgi:hypothetical protein